MPRVSRRALTVPFVHVVNRSIRKAPMLLRPADYRAFLKVMKEGLARHPIRLVAYCILSNHWHLVVRSPDPPTLSRFMQWITASHAQRWHRHRKTVGQGPVYQGRFHASPLAGAGDLLRACRYVERNALSAGLVRRAQDWPWCSLSERLRGDPRVPLETNRFLESDTWVDHVNAVVTLREQLGQLGLSSGRRGALAPNEGKLLKTGTTP